MISGLAGQQMWEPRGAGAVTIRMCTGALLLLGRLGKVHALQADS